MSFCNRWITNAVALLLLGLTGLGVSTLAVAQTPLDVYPTTSGGPYMATLDLFRITDAPLGANTFPSGGWFRTNGANWGSIQQGWLRTVVTPHDPTSCGLIPEEMPKYPIRITLHSSWSNVDVFPATARDKIHIESRVILHPHSDRAGAVQPRVWPYPTTLDVIWPSGPNNREIVFEPFSNFEWVDQDVTLEIRVWLDRALTDGDAWAGAGNPFIYRVPLPMRTIKSSFTRLSPYLLPIAIIGDPPGDQSYSQLAVTEGLGAGLAVYQGNTSSVTTQESFGFGPISITGPEYNTTRSTERGITQRISHQRTKSIATNSPMGPGAGDLMVTLLRPTFALFRGAHDMDFRFLCGPGLPCWQVPPNCASRQALPPPGASPVTQFHVFPMRELQQPTAGTPQASLTPTERAALASLNPLLASPYALLSEPRYYLVDSISGSAFQLTADQSTIQITGAQVSNVVSNSVTRDNSQTISIPIGAIATALGSPIPLPNLVSHTQETTTTTTEFKTVKDLNFTSGTLMSYRIGDSNPNKQLCVETYFDTMFNTFAFRDCNPPPVDVHLKTLAGQLQLASAAQLQWQAFAGERPSAFVVTGSLGAAAPKSGGVLHLSSLDAGKPAYHVGFSPTTANVVVPNMVPGRYRGELQGTVYTVTVGPQGQTTMTSAPKVVAAPQPLSGALVNTYSSRCLDVAGGSLADGANVQQFGCHGGPNQRWTLTAVANGVFVIRNVNSGKCLDVAGASMADQANVQQFACNNGLNQQWSMSALPNGASQFVSRQSGKCLDIAGGSVSDGANVQQFGCHGGGSQSFRLQP